MPLFRGVARDFYGGCFIGWKSISNGETCYFELFICLVDSSWIDMTET